MREYIQRLKEYGSNGHFALWWILRALMIFALAVTLIKNPSDIVLSVQLFSGTVGMFLWEMCMATKKNSFTRFIPAFVQTIVSVCIFVAAFFGEFVGLYKSHPVTGSVMQFILGFVSIFVGYEIACTFIKRDRYYATKAMAFYVAFGLFFMWINATELTEFFLDQIVGLITETPGNNQEWINSGASIIFDPIDKGRFALMDTMTDIIVSTVGAFTGLLIVNIFPYRHRGKHKYDFEFDKAESTKEKELKK